MKDIYILVQNPGENQVNWTYFDQKAQPSRRRLHVRRDRNPSEQVYTVHGWFSHGRWKTR